MTATAALATAAITAALATTVARQALRGLRCLTGASVTSWVQFPCRASEGRWQRTPDPSGIWMPAAKQNGWPSEGSMTRKRLGICRVLDPAPGQWRLTAVQGG